MDNAGGVMKGREAESLETQGGEKPMKVYRKVKRGAIERKQQECVERDTEWLHGLSLC